MGATDSVVAYNVASLICRQYLAIMVSTQTLLGGIAGYLLFANVVGRDVHHLSALVTKLCPGTLQPSMPPNFHVPNANILSSADEWMIIGVHG
eukprot:15112883-Ditylum_brightwellii.AAC.1